MIIVYVDDIIITCSNKEGISLTKAFLKSSFDIKDLGELKYFFGIEICRSKEELFLSQRKYTLDLLSDTGTLGGKPAKTPLEDGYKVLREGEIEDNHMMMSSTIGEWLGNSSTLPSQDHTCALQSTRVANTCKDPRYIIGTWWKDLEIPKRSTMPRSVVGMQQEYRDCRLL